MPLPFVPLALRIGLAAVAGYGFVRWVTPRAGEGRRDQRAEDALDDLGEGLLLHKTASGASPGARQQNASLRLKRIIGFRGREWEIDAGLIARLRFRERRQ